MAHFAELDSNNLVLRVIVISNEDVDANGGDKHTDAETFVASIVPHESTGSSWKQTSYNDNFRKLYAGAGFIYDLSKDKFILPQPYSSWALDASDDWQAPVTYPNVIEISSEQVSITWNEDNLRWDGSVYDEDNPSTDPTNYTWDAANLQWDGV